MKIESIGFRNFASYGNNWQELNFSDKHAFVLIQGKNGVGKSNFSDAIKFGIYGKLENKKLKDIANRLNKHLEVQVKLITKNGKVVIERGIEPGYFRLFLNGKKIDKAGKRSVQDYLEEEILEMPFYVFSNTLSLSINDFKSFIRMNNFDKRAIIDKIFGLQILNQMREILRQQSRLLKEVVDKNTVSARAYTKTLESSQTELDSLLLKIQASKGEREKLLQGKKKDFEAFIKKGRVSEVELKEKIKGAEKLKRDVETTVSGDRQLAKESHTKVELYKNSKCPTCSSDLTTDFHQEIMKQYQSSEIEATERMEETSKRLPKIDQFLKSSKESLIKLQQQLTTAEANFGVIVKELDTINNTNQMDEQTASLKKIVEQAKSNIRKSGSGRSEAEKKMNYYGLVEEILGEKGVKQLAIKSILPSLNYEIQKLVTTLGIEHKIMFDEEFNAKVTHFGIEVSPDTLSTGEQKKVDFAVLMGIIRMMKLKYPGMNLLFLDELFSSIDGDGIYHILKILRNSVEEFKVNTFVISHYPLAYSEFDYTIQITKNRGFSHFEMEKVE